MVSSGVWAGQIPLEKAHNLQEVGGSKQTMRQELHRIGYLGTVEASFKVMPIGVRRSIAAVWLAETDYSRHILNYTLVSSQTCKRAIMVHRRLGLSHLLLVSDTLRKYLKLLGPSHVSSMLAGANECIAYLYIEQGPHLEARNQKIGIVQGVCDRPTLQP